MYVYDSENYDDDEDDRVTDGDDDMIDSGECFLAEGLTEEQVCIVEEFLNFRCLMKLLTRMFKDTSKNGILRDVRLKRKWKRCMVCPSDGLIMSMIGIGEIE